MINARLLFDHLKNELVAHFTFGILQRLDRENESLRHERKRDASALVRLDDENTALRNRLGMTEKGRQSLIDDFRALAVGAPLKTAMGSECLRLMRERESADRQTPEDGSSLAQVPRTWDTGKDKWVHGERDPEGRRYLGPCPICGSRTVDHGGPWVCTNSRGIGCRLAHENAVRQHPFWWKEDIFAKIDWRPHEGGTEYWFAAREGFINIQESDCGFDTTPHGAVASLLFNESRCHSVPPLPLTDVS